MRCECREGVRSWLKCLQAGRDCKTMNFLVTQWQSGASVRTPVSLSNFPIFEEGEVESE